MVKREKDAQGVPFVGKAGKLMNMALAGIGIKREELYIANVVKCRPPANRNPEKDEEEACKEFLEAQIKLVNPKIIVLLGSVALKNILGEEYGITKTRGQWIEKNGIMEAGLFRGAYGATIKNITVSGTIKGTARCGGICSQSNATKYYNCTNKATVSGGAYQ